MHVDHKSVEVYPALAEKWLATSLGNRGVSRPRVLAFAESMNSGRWELNGNTIVFDVDGTLVDGHHRLHAVVQSGKTIPFLVVRGVSPSARVTIDTGRVRTLRDQVRMFFADEITNPKQRIAWVQMSITLLTGNHIHMPDINTFNEWAVHFRAGVNALLPVFGTRKMLSTGPIAGALVFAHRKSPEAVVDFSKRIVDGADLQKGSPELTLTRFLFSFGAMPSGAYRIPLSKKTLNAVKAFSDGVKMERLYDSPIGLEWARSAYSSRKLAELSLPWADGQQVLL